VKPETHIPTAEYAEKHPLLANPGETHLMQHMPQLDGVRAIAVLMVIWWHFMPQHLKVGGAVAPWGAIGVGLFFTLSGFLITRILLNCRLKIDAAKSSVGGMMKQFYIRRFLRIFPLYYGVLLVLFIVNPVNYAEKAPPRVNSRVQVTRDDKTHFLGTVQAVKQAEIVVTRKGVQKKTTIDRFDVVADDGTVSTVDDGQIAVEQTFRARAWWHVAYFSNIRFSYWPKGGEIERHLWSLSVEEQFYLIWPLLIFLPPRKLIGPIIIATIVAAPVWRIVSYNLLDGQGRLGHEWMMPACLDLLGFGALLALLSLPQFGWSRAWNWLVEACGLIGLPLLLIFITAKSLAVFGSPTAAESISYFGVAMESMPGKKGWLSFGFEWPGGATYPITALAAVWLIAMAARGFRGPIGYLLSSPPMVYIGRISYGLYVLHMFVPHLLEWVFQRFSPGTSWEQTREWRQFFTYTAISLGLATISWYAFEAPMNRLKKYFEYDAAKKSASPS
jgi:peptidoglycan/LPS O-acetylase OafA/YrhL